MQHPDEATATAHKPPKLLYNHNHNSHISALVYTDTSRATRINRTYLDELEGGLDLFDILPLQQCPLGAHSDARRPYALCQHHVDVAVHLHLAAERAYTSDEYQQMMLLEDAKYEYIHTTDLCWKPA